MGPSTGISRSVCGDLLKPRVTGNLHRFKLQAIGRIGPTLALVEVNWLAWASLSQVQINRNDRKKLGRSSGPLTDAGLIILQA